MPLQMEIYFINRNFLCQRVIVALPSEFLLRVLFLRIVPVPERRVLGYIQPLFSEILGETMPSNLP